MAKWQKNLPANVGDRHKRCGLDPWVRKIPGGVNGPTPVFLPEKLHRQRSNPTGKIKGKKHIYTHSYTIVFKDLEAEKLELRENGISSVSMK